MIKACLRFLSFFLLCVLIVYVPEIYHAAANPYAQEAASRVLLRVLLCTQDPDSEKAVLQAIHAYIKETNEIHLRITRTGEEDLFSLPDPQADVFIYSADIGVKPERFFAGGKSFPVCIFMPDKGKPLLCAVHRDTRNPDVSGALIRAIESASAFDTGPQSGI